jgi:hypothetical protein
MNDVDKMSSYIDEQKSNDGIDDDTQIQLTSRRSPRRSGTCLTPTFDTNRTILANEHVPPQLLNIDGTVGCGKTYPIKAIAKNRVTWLQSTAIQIPFVLLLRPVSLPSTCLVEQFTLRSGFLSTMTLCLSLAVRLPHFRSSGKTPTS